MLISLDTYRKSKSTKAFDTYRCIPFYGLSVLQHHLVSSISQNNGRHSNVHPRIWRAARLPRVSLFSAKVHASCAFNLSGPGMPSLHG